MEQKENNTGRSHNTRRAVIIAVCAAAAVLAAITIFWLAVSCPGDNTHEPEITAEPVSAQSSAEPETENEEADPVEDTEKESATPDTEKNAGTVVTDTNAVLAEEKEADLPQSSSDSDAEESIPGPASSGDIA